MELFKRQLTYGLHLSHFEGLMALSVKLLNDITTAPKYSSSEGMTWIVCPNPTIADATRVSIEQESLSVQTMTVAKFLNDLFKEHFPDSETVRKSDLKLLLSVVWKNQFIVDKNLSFNQSFDLLTDLRSYTLSETLIDSVLDLFPDEVAQSVRYFWLVMDKQDIIDEHRAYQMLIDYYEQTDIDNELLEDKHLIFNGFTHFSMNQLIFLKALSKRIEVTIPVPSYVYSKRQPHDWVEWLVKDCDHLVLDRDDDDRQSKVPLSFFTKGRLANDLTRLTSVEGQEFDNIIWDKKEIKFEDLLSVPNYHTFFKIDSGVLEQTFEQFFKLIGDKFSHRDDEFVTDEVIDELLSLEKNYREGPLSFKVFAMIKVITLFRNKVEYWRDLSQGNEIFTYFDLEVLKEVISLDLPRVYQQPLMKKASTRLRSLVEVIACVDSRNVLCLSSGHNLGGGSANSPYTSDVYDVLCTLGPMRRQALDDEFVFDLLSCVVKKGKTTILLERGLDHHDTAIEKLMKGLLSEPFSLPPKMMKKESDQNDIKNDETLLIAKTDKLSATRLQTYLDCPKKYYFQYLTKLNVEPAALQNIDPRSLGSLQHKVIEKYCLKHNEFSSDDLSSLIQEEIGHYFHETLLNHLNLRDEIFIETYHYTRFLCAGLMDLKAKDKTVVLDFEVELKHHEAIGRADLVITSERFGSILLDLKRSGGSIPAKSSVEQLKSIQLWYYLNYLQQRDITMMGYINLSDISSSLLLTLDERSHEFIKSSNFIYSENVVSLKESVDLYLTDFNKLYKDSLVAINDGQYMIPAPVSSQTCTYCPGSLVCKKR